MCLNPLTGYRLKRRHPLTHKRIIVFSRKHLYKNDIIMETLNIPCGKCYECLLSRARNWQFRTSVEALDYPNNTCFLTLTYDDKHLPRTYLGIPTLRYKDVQLFIKRLRKEIYPKKIKYFCGAEYGSKTFRPHYHLILYGYTDPLAEFFRTSYSGLPIYRSKHLEKIWNNGYVFYGTTTSNSCGYVSRYCLDKALRINNDKYHDLRDPERLRMSQGIGKKWFINNIDLLRTRPYFVFEGKKYGIPQYFMDILEKINNKLYRKIKFIKEFFQKLKEKKQTYYEFEQQLQVRSILVLKKLKQLRRLLSDDDFIHLLE